MIYLTNKASEVWLLKKILFILLGGLMFGLGTLGIFLPFLPTAVFYLLTAFFWVRSSEKLHGKLVSSDAYQNYVVETLVKKNISTKSLIRMFFVIGLVFLIPAILVDNLVMRVTMAIVYVVHVIALSWYIKGRKTKNRKVAEVQKPYD